MDGHVPLRVTDFTVGTLMSASDLLLHQGVEDGPNGLGTLLWVSLLVRVIHISDAKTGLVALRPLKVAVVEVLVSALSEQLIGVQVNCHGICNNLLHKAPSQVPTDVDVIKGTSFCHRVDVSSKVLHPEVVLEDLVPGHVILALERSAVLGHVDGRPSVAVRDPLHQLPEARGVRS